MSSLDILRKPTVSFDPNNTQHRKWYHDFRRKNSWQACPVRFTVNHDLGDITSVIANMVATYYTNQEFKKSTPKRKTNI